LTVFGGKIITDVRQTSDTNKDKQRQKAEKFRVNEGSRQTDIQTEGTTIKTEKCHTGWNGCIWPKYLPKLCARHIDNNRLLGQLRRHVFNAIFGFL